MVVQYLIADFVYILSDLQSFIACKNYSWQIPKNHLLLICDLSTTEVNTQHQRFSALSQLKPSKDESTLYSLFPSLYIFRTHLYNPQY